MFIRLHRGEAIQNFNVWVYDDKGLVRGSGLFVSKNELLANHHFLMPRDGTSYGFLSGEYLMQVFIDGVGDNPKKIFGQMLVITSAQHEKMIAQKAGLYFDWAPNTQNYFSHIDTRPKKNEDVTDLIGKFIQDR